MTWMKWRATFREGSSDTWEWVDLGVDGRAQAEAMAKDVRAGLAADHELRYPDGFRTIEYELVEVPPAEVIKSFLKDLKEALARNHSRAEELQGFLEGSFQQGLNRKKPMTCEHHKTCGDCFSPSFVMDLENTIKYAGEGLAYATECNLATLSGLQITKRTSKSTIRRQRDICLKMLRNCGALYEHIKWVSGNQRNFSRVQDILDAGGAGPAEAKKHPGIEKALEAWMAAVL